MEEVKLTPQQIEQLTAHIFQAKPHLTKIEEEINKVGFGTIQVQMTVRAGVIEKMEFFETRSWIRQNPKTQGDVDSNSDK